MNVLDYLFLLWGSLTFAFRQVRSLPVGEAHEVDIPDITIDYKGDRYRIVALSVERIK